MSERPRPTPSQMERILLAKSDWHRRQAELPLREKVRILLALQRQCHPILEGRRELQWWERPWEIEP